MTVLNINDKPTSGVVLLDPDTGNPIVPGRVSLTLEAALMLFPMKEQVAAMMSDVSSKPSYALLMPADRQQATYVGYGQAVPLRLKASEGSDISVADNKITLKAGKTYKLQASLSALYQFMSGAFAWTKPNSFEVLGVNGATNGSQWYGGNKGDAVTVIKTDSDTEVQLTYMCPWAAMYISGGNEWDFNSPAGSWITVEELK